MNPRESPTEFDWEATTWEGSRRRQLQVWARLTLDEIFAAQEEMAEFAQALRDAPSSPPATPQSPAADSGPE
mgnify:CR=1 FL=1